MKDAAVVNDEYFALQKQQENDKVKLMGRQKQDINQDKNEPSNLSRREESRTGKIARSHTAGIVVTSKGISNQKRDNTP